MPQYKIKSGDTLSQIAKSKGFTLKQLMGANKNIKDPNKLKQELHYSYPIVRLV